MHPNQKQALDKALKHIINSPESGTLKTGDLSILRVFKYKLHGTEQLLGYSYDAANQTLNLISVGSHENFYRDLKR